jgi:2-methylisocitrate lyase-like PEP mutase family enzyme
VLLLFQWYDASAVSPNLSLAEKADRFRSLHHGPSILVLPNAWDVASARIFEEAGFGALATTSAGIAMSLGYPDGERISRAEMLAAVARIARAVAIPVTADMEAGYGPTPEDAAETARGVIEAGAIGLNLEDAREGGLVNVDLQVERIRAMRRAAEAAGVPLVINARTDVYLRAAGPPESRFAETVRRANAYRDAGADCLFVPLVGDAETIGKLAREIHGPLNILALPGVPAAGELQKLGVARVSMGSGVMRSTLTHTRRIAQQLKAEGASALMTEGLMDDPRVQQMMQS